MDGIKLQAQTEEIETKSTKAMKVAPDGSFVNTGLQKWEEGRKDWLAKAAAANPAFQKDKVQAVDLDVDEVIDCIVSNRWRSALKGGKDKATFPKPVPLPQMIDILTDLWEAEGLD
ncbi:hypothetical protein CTEN210_06555 [Chaetoceros tenuissimus]|uniref:Gag1-like clamp domain-containing protein n=1 Tax=Chaetoceros tenuissimus TaxID=426638 RepID=A0AAD3CQQ6_9STRA|nr:hypothetical protein CTEN210_06555 [Chaetoceros tenuissimus]